MLSEPSILKLVPGGRFFFLQVLKELLKVAEKGPSPSRHFCLACLVCAWLGVCAVVTPEQVLYDRYFDAATFALEAQSSGDSVAYWLVLTYDEGHIQVPMGSELLVRLRDRSTITLSTDREVGRGDLLLRRWRDVTNYYVRCYYPVTRAQLGRMLDKDVYRLEISTARGPIVRPIRHFKAKLSQAFSHVEKHIIQ